MSAPQRPRPLFCGNWKLFGSLSESLALATGVRDAVREIVGTDVAVAPGFVALAAVAEKLKDSAVAVSGQDCYWETKGAFTGSVAAAQIADAGGSMVIVGHSERRQYFGDTDADVAKKTRAALAAGLTPIVCVGEVLAERDAGQAKPRVGAQLAAVIKDMSPADVAKIVIAYEPVWAIGTGRNATPAQAAEVHKFIRSQLAGRAGAPAAQAMRILYGGSVKPDNVAGLMAEQELDGALVGGASLTAESFAKIVKEGTAACTRH